MELLQFGVGQRLLHHIRYQPWTEKALTIEQELRQSPWGFAVEKLLHYSSACGTYLAKLAKMMPDRVSKAVKDGASVWTITPPKESKE